MLLISVSSRDLLRPDKFVTVLNSAFPARSRYYELGKNLGLDIGTLEAIKHDQRDQSEEGLREVLLMWIRNSPIHPSWKSLADALKAPNVGVIVTS